MKNNKGSQRGSRRSFGEPRRVFGAPAGDAYQLPSAASTPEELLILGALKRCGGDGVPSKSLQREAGIRDKDSFYAALKSLEELREVTVDRDHWVKLVPPAKELEAEIVSLSARFGVRINYSIPNRSQFQEIVLTLAQRQGVTIDQETLLAEANKWELRHGGVSGRTAQQFIHYISGCVDAT